MSSFTPRHWKLQTAPEAERHVEPPVEQLPPRGAVKSNNLPIAHTAFIGREQDVAEVKELLERHRLGTLVGSGGVGKTRLAVQVGSELLDAYPDGVWFVDLAPIADPELVSSVVAQTLGMNQQQGQRVDESIPPWLERKRLLLIFDNCEHVVDAVASLASAILAKAKDVHILATSRQALGIGEEAVRVRSLDAPTSIALFVSRATSADRSFALTGNTAPIVADICRRLDGIPLAIELAAARVKVLSIPHLAERLNERFKLLTGGSRSALPRQQTLHALLDWSYDLLTEQEQRLFARLGIFAGGFGLNAATNVCGGDGLDELDILDLLGSLTDKSLIVADTSGESERYRLLESTAAYALEKLRASGEYDALARRHVEYFGAQAQAADERRGIVSSAEWLSSVEPDLDNYRSALTWALTQRHDAGAGGTIAGTLSSLWTNAGLAVEGRYWVERALDTVSEVEQPRVAARLQLALTSFLSGTPRRDAAERAMRLYASSGDVRSAARARLGIACALFEMGDLDATYSENAQALATSRACEDAWYVAENLNLQALIVKERGDLAGAREVFAQALAAYKALGNEAAPAVLLTSMAELEFADGHPDQALRWIGEALEIERRGKNAAIIALEYNNDAAYRFALNDFAGARRSTCEGLRFGRQGRLEFVIVIALQHLALLAAIDGNCRRAAQLLGYVDARYTEAGVKREFTEQWGYDKLLAALRDALDEDEITQLSAEGSTWSEDRAVEEATQV